MKVLVTGGAGFIGARFARLLMAEGHEVTVFDALTYAGSRERLAGIDGQPGFAFVQGDVCDRPAVLDAMAGHDAVAHLAAESHVDRAIVAPDRFVQTNCLGTNVVVDTARELAVGRVLHVSTDEVYGSRVTGTSSEDDPLRPSNPYSASKAASDLIALSYHVTHGVPVVVTRGANTYGPFQLPEKFIPRFIVNLLDGVPAPLYGDGAQEREWLHVDDHCAGLLRVLEAGQAGSIYNLGSGEHRRNRDTATALAHLCGADSALIQPVTDRLGHDRRYALDSGRAAALGWSPTQAFDVGLQETVGWYRTEESWWRPLLERAALP